jgi:hypothetical protein
MKQLPIVKIWKQIYPYLVIARVGGLVLCSLAVLQADQLVRNLMKSSKPSEEEELRYVNRIH